MKHAPDGPDGWMLPGVGAVGNSLLLIKSQVSHIILMSSAVQFPELTAVQ